MKMRRRLAKKIVDHHRRYSRGRRQKAMVRMGWRLTEFKLNVSIAKGPVVPMPFDVAFKTERIKR